MSKKSLRPLLNQAKNLLENTKDIVSIATYWDNSYKPVLRIEVEEGAKVEQIREKLNQIEPKPKILINSVKVHRTQLIIT